MSKKNDEDFFTRFTSTTSSYLGRPWIFVGALIILIVWAASGPLLGFSDTWQLIINTGTTIVTFLMVFIIQNTQNRDNLAMNIKLDALLRRLDVTKKNIVEAEDKSDKELEKAIRREQKKSRSG
jgi:low affinity Fe/Cu permease